MQEKSYRYINAIRKQPVDRTPLWIMRQAGRYLPEYQAVRDKYDFITVCKTPELATEVTLQPIRRFDFDAAILFSDILVIPEAMGQKLEFLENHGPKLSPQILSGKDISELSVNNLTSRLTYVADAIRMVRKELNGKTPLIGFSGSPFTLATYMIEGKPTRNFKFIKQLMYTDPQLLHRLLSMLTVAVSEYLIMQIEAGAEAVQVFDTWGGIIPPHLYLEFSGNHLKTITSNLKKYNCPVTLFSKGGIELLEKLGDSGADMLGVDWMTDMREARERAGHLAALQGNLDPTILYGKREIIKQETVKILEVFNGQSGHVFNLGHGILPDIPVDNVSFLVDTVRETSVKLQEKYS
ncbi:MAG: uroporphyrinogen decarboxylase [Cyclobacteriaceae bacterium]|nr:uroporphyrinogen decarboxylase [Cyclobacteriaceae bacterium]